MMNLGFIFAIFQANLLQNSFQTLIDPFQQQQKQSRISQNFQYFYSTIPNMFTQDFDDQMRQTYIHRTRNKAQQGLLISQLDSSDFNVPQKVFLEILNQLKKRKVSQGQDPELINYLDYQWIFTECQSRPVRHETIEQIYKKLKGSRNLTVSGLLALIQSKRPQTTEVDILNLLRRFGINYTEHEGILPREFIQLLGRAQRSTS